MAAELELDPRLTIFLGPNGAGKTNILEALALLSIPRSFRGSKDADLIQWSAEFARVAGLISYEAGPSRELVVFVNGGKKLQVDGQTKPMAEFLGQFVAVIFAPEEVDLLSGPPSARRSFLDSHLSLLSPVYLQQLLSYQQVLVRRNKLLSRQQWPSADDLEYWNQQQVDLGSAIIQSRLEAVEQLNIALPSSMQLRYQSPLVIDEESIVETFRRKQANILEREKIVGHSLLGPQRDDWQLLFSDLDMSVGQFGSRGQQRMGVIALKQAQLHIISETKQETAVLLLDDVLSELDAKNQQQLLDSINKQQTVLTTASLADIPSPLLKDVTIYEIVDGEWQKR